MPCSRCLTADSSGLPAGGGGAAVGAHVGGVGGQQPWVRMLAAAATRRRESGYGSVVRAMPCTVLHAMAHKDTGHTRTQCPPTARGRTGAPACLHKASSPPPQHTHTLQQVLQLIIVPGASRRACKERLGHAHAVHKVGTRACCAWPWHSAYTPHTRVGTRKPRPCVACVMKPMGRCLHFTTHATQGRGWAAGRGVRVHQRSSGATLLHG